jgi:hypothetical protein
MDKQIGADRATSYSSASVKVIVAAGLINAALLHRSSISRYNQIRTALLFASVLLCKTRKHTADWMIRSQL